ncbi:MAG: hypothetical protein OXC06_01920 [Acidimicrobiaceae bacterium]|nr:hypothetical protein [Acidimicrobiaceae bacterium]
MAVTEAERAGLVQALVATIGEEPARTLMNCIIPEGRDQLATKADIERHETMTAAGFALVEAEFVKINGKFTEIDGRFTEIDGKFTKVEGQFDKIDARFTKVDGQFKELRGYIDLAMAKQTRTMVYIMAGFALTTWVSMAGVIIAFVSLAP